MAAGNADGSIVISTVLDNSGFSKGSQRLLNAIRSLHSRVNLLQVTFKSLRVTVRAVNKVLKTGAVVALAGVTAEIVAAVTAAKKAVSVFKQFAGGLITKGLGGMASLLKGVGAGLLNFAKNAVVKAVDWIKSAVVEGLGILAQQDTQLRGVINDFNTALSGLKLNLASAFAPLVETVLPILTAFINKLSEAASYVGQFFSALTGRSTYKKVIPAQEDIAKGADKTTQSMGGETDAAKDLKKELMGFDDVNILHGPDNNNNNKIDQGTLSPVKTPTVQELPVDSKFGNLVDKLKAMWANADFTDLGRILGEKLRDALNSIPWDQIKGAAQKVAKSLATLLNGFIETPGLFEAIGVTLAQGLNTAFEFLNEFAKNFHFGSLGTAVGNGINAALGAIDWPLIYDTFRNWGTGIAQALSTFLQTTDWALVGETLANSINVIFTGLYAFVEEFDWNAFGGAILDSVVSTLTNIDWQLIYDTMSSLGRGIGEALNTALNNPEIWTQLFGVITQGINAVLTGLNEFLIAINWAEMGQNIGNGLNNAVEMFDWNLISDTLINLINGAFDLWYNFVTTFDFFKFGSHIGQTLSDAVNGINWEEGGASVAATINALLDALNGFVTTTDWESIGRAVIDVIGGFFGETDWSSVSALLGNAITALCNFLTGAISETDWESIPSEVKRVLGELLVGIDWSETASSVMELVGAALAAAIKLVVGLAEAVGDWIKDGVLGAVDYFGTAIEECGGNVVAGILKGISDAVVGIASWIYENIFKRFIDGFKEVFGIHSPADTMLEFGGYIMEGILNGIIDALVEIDTWIKENIFDPIVDGIKTLFGLDGGESTIFSGFGGDIIKGLLSGIINGLSDIATWLDTNVFTPITDGFKSLFGIGNEDSSIFSDFGGNLIEGLKNGLVDAIHGISDWIDTNITGPILGFFKDLFGIGSPSTIFMDYGGWMIEGLKDGLLNMIDGIGDWIDSNVTGPILGFFEDLFGIGSPSKVFNEYGGYLMEGLEGGIDENTGKVESALSGVNTSVDTAMTKMQRSVESTTGKAKSSIESNFGKAKTSAGTQTSGLYTETKNYMGKITDNVKSQTDSQYKYILNSWKGLALAMPGKMTDVKTKVSDGMGAIKTTVTDTMPSIKGSIDDTMKNITESVKTCSKGLAGIMRDGVGEIPGAISGSTYNAVTAAQGMASQISGAFNDQNWWQLGSNIGQGIYDGLLANNGSLRVLAWNTAVDMYNAAARALDIGSPSKKFYWLSEMITAGMTNGLEDTMDAPIDAIGSIAESMVDEADGVSPIIPISTEVDSALDGFSNVLDSFADRMTDSFAAMIHSMESIASGASFYVPAVAAGARVPYSVNSAAMSQNRSADLADAVRLMAAQNTGLTRQDLVEVMTSLAPLFRSEFYIGDEQVARHANSGNDRLNRRYSSTNATR